MVRTGTIPEGFGHLYTTRANAQAWIAMTRPDNWTPAETARLMAFLHDTDPEG